MSVAHDPSGLFCPLPWPYTVLGAYESPKGRGDGRVVGGPAGSGALAWPQRECLGAHPIPAGSWSRDW